MSKVDLIKERVRTGVVPLEHVAFASWLGDPSAQVVAGSASLPGPDLREAWIRFALHAAEATLERRYLQLSTQRLQLVFPVLYLRQALQTQLPPVDLAKAEVAGVIDAAPPTLISFVDRSVDPPRQRPPVPKSPHDLLTLTSLEFALASLWSEPVGEGLQVPRRRFLYSEEAEPLPLTTRSLALAAGRSSLSALRGQEAMNLAGAAVAAGATRAEASAGLDESRVERRARCALEGVHSERLLPWLLGDSDWLRSGCPPADMSLLDPRNRHSFPHYKAIESAELALFGEPRSH